MYVAFLDPTTYQVLTSLTYSGAERPGDARHLDGVAFAIRLGTSFTLVRIPGIQYVMESSLRRLALTLSALAATGLMLTACGGSSSSSPEADPQKVSSGQTSPSSGR